MGIIEELKIKGFPVKMLKGRCPFCGSVCAEVHTFGIHVICDNPACGADIQFFGCEKNQIGTKLRFERREPDGTVESDQGDL